MHSLETRLGIYNDNENDGKNTEHVRYDHDMLVMYSNGRASIQNSNQHSMEKKPQLTVLHVLHHF